MSKVLKYRYRCNTENKNIFEWRDEADGAPTACKNDAGHTINTSSIAVVQTKEDKKVVIQEENVETGGHFQSRQFKLTAAANSWTELDLSWEYPVSVLDAEFVTIEEMKDDEIEVIVAPNTVVGAITSNVAATETVIDVQQSVIDNIEIGYSVNLYDGTNEDDLGYVIAIDKANLQITVSVEASQAFSAATPTYVRMSPKMVRNYTIGHAGRYTVGQGKIGGSYIPAGTVIRVRYNNKHATDTKYFYAELDYLY